MKKIIEHLEDHIQRLNDDIKFYQGQINKMLNTIKKYENKINIFNKCLLEWKEILKKYRGKT